MHRLPPGKGFSNNVPPRGRGCVYVSQQLAVYAKPQSTQSIKTLSLKPVPPSWSEVPLYHSHCDPISEVLQASCGLFIQRVALWWPPTASLTVRDSGYSPTRRMWPVFCGDAPSIALYLLRSMRRFNNFRGERNLPGFFTKFKRRTYEWCSWLSQSYTN